MAIKRQMDPETHYPIIINALLHPLLFVVYSFLMTSQLDRCTPSTPFPYAYQGQRQRGHNAMDPSQLNFALFFLFGKKPSKCIQK